MNAMSRDAMKAYSNASVEANLEGVSPHQLIVMLFDGAVRSVAKARMAMQKKDVITKCASISHAMAIIQDGLQLSLDIKAGGEMAQNLNDLYDYMCDRLLIANMNNEIGALDEVGRLLVDLRGAWSAIGQKPLPAKPVNVAVEAPPQRNSAISYGKA